MTTGNLVYNNCSPGPNACGGNPVIGTSSYVNWSGGDRSPGSLSLAPHNYTKNWATVTDVRVEVNPLYDPTGIGGTVLTCIGLQTGSDPWGPNDDISLINKLGKKVRGHDLNLAVVLAESKDTISLVANTASAIYRSVKAIKHGNFVRAANVLGIDLRRKTGLSVRNSLADNWLALQYGWLPLLSDVNSAMEALAAKRKPQQARFRKTLSVEHVDLFENGGVIWKTFNSTRKSIAVTLSQSEDTLTSLRLDDPLTVAWELTPFSFVADWFIPVGDYLSASQVIHALPVTQVVTSTKRVQRSWLLASGPNVTGGQGFVHTTGTFSRVVSADLPTLPLPSLHDWTEIYSPRRALNAIALLQGRFRR